MRKSFLALGLALMLIFAGACGAAPAPTATPAPTAEATPPATAEPESAWPFVLTDAAGRELSFEACPERVVALMGSFGEAWLDAGGALVGITDDALSERGMGLSEDVTMVGTIKNPSIETVISLDPDFVILSADTTSHKDVAAALDDLGIRYAMFHVELFEDYLSMLRDFTRLTGRDDLYEKNGLDIQTQIDGVLADSPSFEGQSALLLRAYSSGWKAKDSTTLAGAIIADFGFENVVERYDTQLEELSLEEIVKLDPDYIFVTIMGSDIEGTKQLLKDQLESNPAWSGLTAVESGHYFILPQDLFHFKPNVRWGESYQYLSDLLNK